MALDGLVVHAIVNELQSCVGGRISKIHIPSHNDILLQIRANNSNYKLLLSANPTHPRVHFTEKQFPNPLEAPMFCMLLRKHCEGGIIESIAQLDLERVIRIQIRHKDELGDISCKTIDIEIMGRHSNIILWDPVSGIILDGIHHVTPAISSHRIVLPGSSYVSPPDQGKQNPLTLTAAQCIATIVMPGNDEHEVADSYQKQIVAKFSGISPLAAQEIVFRATEASLLPMSQEQEREVICEVFCHLMQQIKQQSYKPTIVTSDSGKAYFSIMALTHLEGEVSQFATISECLESYYGDKAERDTIKQRMADLLRFLQTERNKNVKKLDKLQTTLDEGKEADQYRFLGELLSASMHQMKKGDKQIEVVNYYDEEQKNIAIDLDPLLTPSENAQRYFKKYRKVKNSITVVTTQIQSTHEEILYLESLLQQIDNASLADIAEIREELIEQGYIRDRSKKNRKKKKVLKPVLSCFTSSEGIPIYVGKNNTQNEYLTNRLAQSSDTWLHTKDIPGSHVVIRSAQFGDKTLSEAAQLAAFYSQAKQSSQVPVDYTQIRHVHKPSGAKPGFVIYDHQKTLFITPEEQKLKQLKVEMKS